MDGTVAQAETLRFITGNAGKAKELALALEPHGWNVVQTNADCPEIQADSLEEVAEASARHLLDAGVEPPFVLEDAGLFVGALNGFPGVYSRHALETIGCAGLLRLLANVEPEVRSAAFRACLTYVDAAGTIQSFPGTCKGTIAARARGNQGFGFDSVFVPEGDARTFGEMDAAEKGGFSHRAKAAEAFVSHLIQSAKR